MSSRSVRFAKISAGTLALATFAGAFVACFTESIPSAGGPTPAPDSFRVPTIATFPGELHSFGVSKTHVCFATTEAAPGKKIACVRRSGQNLVTILDATRPAPDGGSSSADGGSVPVDEDAWSEISAVAEDYVYFRPRTRDGVSSVLRAPVDGGPIETIQVLLPETLRFGGALRYEPKTRTLVAFTIGVAHDRALVRFPADGPQADAGVLPIVELARADGVFAGDSADLVPVGNGYVYVSGLTSFDLRYVGPIPDAGDGVRPIVTVPERPASLKLLRGQGENALGPDHVYFAQSGTGYAVSATASDGGATPFGVRLASTPICQDDRFVYIAGRTGEYRGDAGSTEDPPGIYRVARSNFSEIGAIAELHAELVNAGSEELFFRVVCDGQDIVAFAPQDVSSDEARFGLYVFPR